MPSKGSNSPRILLDCTKPKAVLNMVMNAVFTLGAPRSGQFSSIRFKSSSVQSLSKTIFCPPSIAVLLLSSSSLSLSGPMIACPGNSAGEKHCSVWEDTGTMQPPLPHTRVSRLPICVILLKSRPGLGQGRISES